MVPLKLLKERLRTKRLERVLRKSGMGPERLFQLRSRNLRLWSLAMLGWMGPVRFGSLWSMRVSKNGRSPT